MNRDKILTILKHPFKMSPVQKVWRRRIVGRENGQSLLEFALVLPILLLFMLGIMEFGRILLMYSAVSNAAREAARYGAVAGDIGGGTPHYLDCDGIREMARDTVVLTSLSEADIAIRYDRDDGSGGMAVFANCGDAGLSAADIQSEDRIVVTVTTTFEPIVPLVPVPPLPVTVVTARTILKEIIVGAAP